MSSTTRRPALLRALRLIDDDHRQRPDNWLQLESELLLEGNEDRRTGRGWEGEITRPGL